MSEFKVGTTITIDGISLQILDEEPKEITNPYSGESCKLTPDAIALYDMIKGAELLHDYELVQKGLAAFSKRWPNEYFTLLD